MKTNEAPEKIYINSDIEKRTWLIGKGDISFIEYTRTDAFIKKACDWLNNNVDDYWRSKFVDSGAMVEDFRKYMED